MSDAATLQGFIGTALDHIEANESLPDRIRRMSAEGLLIDAATGKAIEADAGQPLPQWDRTFAKIDGRA